MFFLLNSDNSFIVALEPIVLKKYIAIVMALVACSFMNY